jgi:hypothetical protein
LPFYCPLRRARRIINILVDANNEGGNKFVIEQLGMHICAIVIVGKANCESEGCDGI